MEDKEKSGGEEWGDVGRWKEEEEEERRTEGETKRVSRGGRGEGEIAGQELVGSTKPGGRIYEVNQVRWHKRGT